MNTPTESAAQGSGKTFNQRLREAIWFGRRNASVTPAKFADMEDAFIGEVEAPQPPITKDAPAPAQDGVKVEYRKALQAIAEGEGDAQVIAQQTLDYCIDEGCDHHGTLHTCTSSPLQPTPPAQPVIGQLYPSLQIGGRRWFIRCELPKRLFDTEAEALAFIESCRPAQPNGDKS
mgnify:CR=1 FL=1